MSVMETAMVHPTDTTVCHGYLPDRANAAIFLMRRRREGLTSEVIPLAYFRNDATYRLFTEHHHGWKETPVAKP